jgi:hypothetical protein
MLPVLVQSRSVASSAPTRDDQQIAFSWRYGRGSNPCRRQTDGTLFAVETEWCGTNTAALGDLPMEPSGAFPANRVQGAVALSHAA